MNPVSKRLRLSPRPPRSHDALLLPPPAGGGAPEEEEFLLVEEDTDSSLIITMEDSQQDVRTRRRAVRKKKKKEDGRGGVSESEEEGAGPEVEIDRQLDQSLETKSKQHNLTTVNVRNIIHEVITNEHVVAMMKAAINETEAVPAFEPKMTRSKFKEVVEKGVVIPAWNISPIKKTTDVNKPPQFVDIPLAEEDSSDEEYHPDEEEEDETAEDTFQESDLESSASSPRGSRLNRAEEDSSSPWQSRRSRSRRSRTGVVSMGPPPPPKAAPPRVADSVFLEELHAVEEELAVCLEPLQSLSESQDQVGLMAYRTRSKRPLRDVPLGRLEAELRAPDITPDMYDSGPAHQDRDWTDWLRGLMTSDMENEEECDDEDDPEYNFLAEIDEPDVEDYRDDKAVRITKKEVNELMEELFETLKEDLVGQEVDDEEEEPQTHTPQEQHHTMPGNDEAENRPITELRTVKQQLALLRKRRQTHTHCPDTHTHCPDTHTHCPDTHTHCPNTHTRCPDTHTQCNTHTHCAEPPTLRLGGRQRIRLQQQLQQHVQLLTQIHLLSSTVIRLQSEAETTRQFLVELDLLAQRGELLAGRPGFCSAFRASNLQGALQLLEELLRTPIVHQQPRRAPDARGYMRSYPVLPAELAWLFSTRPVFLYPELLPVCSLDPDLYCPRRTAAFTAGEDCLLVLGLRNMGGSPDPTKLVSQFLLRKTLVQVRRRVLQCNRPGVPDNIVKAFRYQRVLWPMRPVCRRVNPDQQRPPVEREEDAMPPWLLRSLPVIYSTIRDSTRPPGPAAPALPPRHSHMTYSFPPGTRYPPRLPKQLHFRRIGFLLLQKPRPPPPPPGTASAVSMTTRERIRRHYQTLVGLRKKRRRRSVRDDVIGTEESDDVIRREESDDIIRTESDDVIRTEESDDVIRREESDDVIRTEESEDVIRTEKSDDVIRTEKSDDVIRTEESDDVIRTEESNDVMRLVLSESSPSSAGSVAPDDSEVESEKEQEVTADEEEEESVFRVQESSDYEEEAQDYLLRVCDAVQVSSGVSEQLLQILDQVSGSAAAERLYAALRRLLQPWPQLLRDFAAFLNRRQARRCGLLTEQQQFEHSRRFLRRLGRSLGGGSALYQQVVLALQRGSAPPPEELHQISSRLRRHSDLHKEFWEFIQQLHGGPSPAETNPPEMDYVSQNPPGGDKQTGSDGEKEEEAESERPLGAKNISMTSLGEKVVVWTREADRTILTACQQRGANRKTFRQVSAQLGNKTAQQVSLRFHDLMNLFHSAFQQHTSCSSTGQPISR